MGEFATPVLSMYEMQQEMIAGLSTKEKVNQTVLFRHTLDNILKHDDHTPLN